MPSSRLQHTEFVLERPHHNTPYVCWRHVQLSRSIACVGIRLLYRHTRQALNRCDGCGQNSVSNEQRAGKVTRDHSRNFISFCVILNTANDINNSKNDFQTIPVRFLLQPFESRKSLNYFFITEKNTKFVVFKIQLYVLFCGEYSVN